MFLILIEHLLWFQHSQHVSNRMRILYQRYKPLCFQLVILPLLRIGKHYSVGL